jgi:hypothetical protein
LIRQIPELLLLLSARELLVAPSDLNELSIICESVPDMHVAMIGFTDKGKDDEHALEHWCRVAQQGSRRDAQK